MIVTPELKIPLIEDSDLVSKDVINRGFEAIDNNVAPITHVSSNNHWILWKSNTAYQKQDVFRTTTIPSWGYWEVTKAGTSGTAEPFGAGEGDTATDGTCEIVLRRLTTTGSVNSWQLWPTFKETTAYAKGDVFRTRTCPSWGYWEVTKTGTSGKTEPFSTIEGTMEKSGSMECVLTSICSKSEAKKQAIKYSLVF